MKSKLIFSLFIASIIIAMAYCAFMPMPNQRQTNEADIIANGRYISEAENAD